LQTAAMTLPRQLRCAQLWMLSGGRPEKLFRLDPNRIVQLPDKALGGGCGWSFCVYLPKYYHMEIDTVNCEFIMTDESRMEARMMDVVRLDPLMPVSTPDNRRTLRVAFSLKL